MNDRIKKGFLRRILCFILCTLCFAGTVSQKVEASNITVCSVTFYTKPATPCYAAPDLNSRIVTYLEKFLPVNVTGFTDNGFFRVNIGTDVYIPVAFLSETLNNKSKEQIEKEKLADCAFAYKIQLEHLDGLAKNFGLFDVNGDGFPELVTDNDQIFTYYDKRPYMAYYNAYDCSLYYHKASNTLVAKLKYDDKTHWEIYSYSTATLPSGYFTCVSTNVDPYGNALTKIEYPFKNDSKTRDALTEHLYHLNGYGEKCKICKKYY